MHTTAKTTPTFFNLWQQEIVDHYSVALTIHQINTVKRYLNIFDTIEKISRALRYGDDVYPTLYQLNLFKTRGLLQLNFCMWKNITNNHLNYALVV